MEGGETKNGGNESGGTDLTDPVFEFVPVVFMHLVKAGDFDPENDRIIGTPADIETR